jgi:hypothetical protein
VFDVFEGGKRRPPTASFLNVATQASAIAAPAASDLSKQQPAAGSVDAAISTNSCAT